MKSDKERFKKIKEAQYLSFQQRNKSPQSQQFFIEVIGHLLTIEVRNRKRKAKLKDKETFRIAVERTLANLMVAAGNLDSQWAYRELGNDTFSGEVFKVDTFKKAIRLLEEAGFIESVRGGNHSNPFHNNGDTNSKAFNPGLATRFRVTNDLLDIAANYGITTDNIRSHYLQTLPSSVIRKKAASTKTYGKKITGRQMRIKKDATVLRLEKQVKRINLYLDYQHLENVVFNGYYRIFNLGDQNGFNWNKGGRLCSTGKDSYQHLKEQQRLSTIRINGEPIVEVDINASYLSIYHGLLGEPLPSREDIYGIQGLHRSIVKAWVTAAFGNEKLPVRWPPDAKAKLIKNGVCLDGLTMKKVGAIVCEHIPVMRQLPSSGITWADLMFIESEAIIATMEALRDNYNIPAYSMHDGLIVPASAGSTTAREIIKTFDLIGIECRVKIETQG